MAVVALVDGGNIGQGGLGWDGVDEGVGDGQRDGDEVGDEEEFGVVGGILVKTEDYVVVEVGAVGDSGPVSCRVVVGWLESREELGG